MKRSLLTLAFLAFVGTGPSWAVDCAKMTSGDEALTGTETIHTTPGDGPVAATIDLTPGAEATLAQSTSPDAVTVIAYVGGELNSRTDQSTGVRLTFVESDVVGDIHASEPGAKSRYVLAVLRDGTTVSRTRFDRVVLGVGMREISGCAFPVLRRRLAGITEGTGKKVSAESEDSPTLGIPLWSRATFETNAGPFVNETTMTSLRLKR